MMMNNFTNFGASNNNKDDKEPPVTLLNEKQIQHDIAWAQLHEALYPRERLTSWSRHNVHAFGITQAAAALAAVRSVSDTYELHYAIAEFFSMTMTLLAKLPVDPDLQSMKAETDTFLNETIPEFMREFPERVAPLFSRVAAKLKSGNDSTAIPARGSVDHHNFLLANAYMARCYFIVGDDASVERARACVQLVRDEIKSTPNADTTLDQDYTVVEQSVINGPVAPWKAYYVIFNAAFVPPPKAPTGVHCGTAPHSWQSYKCMVPTFCQFCQRFINWQQNQKSVFRCAHCSFTAHEDCADELGGDAVCPVASNTQGWTMEEHVHVMKKKTLLLKPTWCAHCKEHIKNPFGASACSICAVEVHDSCLEKMSNVLVAKN